MEGTRHDPPSGMVLHLRRRAGRLDRRELDRERAMMHGLLFKFLALFRRRRFTQKQRLIGHALLNSTPRL